MPRLQREKLVKVLGYLRSLRDEVLHGKSRALGSVLPAVCRLRAYKTCPWGKGSLRFGSVCARTNIRPPSFRLSRRSITRRSVPLVNDPPVPAAVGYQNYP